MSNWKENTLGAISSIITGPFGSQLHQSDYVDTGTAVIMPQNIRDREIDFDGIAYVNDEDAIRLKRYRIEKNDLVYSRRGDVEKHAFITAEFAGALCGTGCLRVRFNTPEVYPIFISLFLNKPETKKWLTQNAVGSNMPNLNKEILSSIPIAYPEKQEQISIAITLSDIEQKVSLNNRIISELEAMAKTIYDYWFVQFDFPNDEGKPYRQSGGEMEYNETLSREIPKGWRVETIGELLTKVPNTTKVLTTDYAILGKLPVIDQSTNFISGYVDDDAAKISIENGAIVFGDHTRIVKYIGFDFARGADGTQILISKNQKTMPQLLLYQVVKAADLSNYGYARHFKFLKAYPCVIPCESVGEKFQNAVNPTYKDITHRIFENLELAHLRDWLLPMLMNGHATVADV